MNELDFIDNTLTDASDIWQMLIRFLFNALVTGFIIRYQYYPKSRRRDYVFTFSLISTSIFFLIFLLGGIKLKIGFALGLFAIFGIIRYRTEGMPVREMTYMFVLITLSVINALTVSLNYIELSVTNLIFIITIRLCENNRHLNHVSCKIVMYDKIDLIKPQCNKELIEDLSARTGLTIMKVEIGSIDFLRDTALLKIYYEDPDGVSDSINKTLNLPKPENL